MRQGLRSVRRVLRVVGPVLLVATLAKELRKPKAERTWHGKVLGFVPYDFRPPTLERLKASFWNPADRHILTGRPMGVGWAINFYEVGRRLKVAS